MVFIGFAWFVTFLADSEDPVVFTLGTALQNVYLLGFVYLVLSFPSGRLRGRLERILFLAAIVLTIVVEIRVPALRRLDGLLFRIVPRMRSSSLQQRPRGGDSPGPAGCGTRLLPLYGGAAG